MEGKECIELVGQEYNTVVNVLSWKVEDINSRYLFNDETVPREEN